MHESIKYAKELIKHNKVKKIGEPSKLGQLYEVNNYTVRIFTKPGRQLISCSCQNNSRFPTESFCCHKLAIIIFESDNDFNTKIRKIKEDYEKYRKNNLNPGILCFLDDLDRLIKVK